MPEPSLYDYPKYYDVLFGSEWKAEVDFLVACFERHATRRVKRVFEPACGTGRVLFRLARAGYRVGGLDLNEPSVRYCNARLARHGFPRTAFVGDMSDFRLRAPVDGAFNLINSFRHLTSGRAAKAHLRCVAEALRTGGIYVLGLHLTPTVGAPMEEESWSARRGSLEVATHMWTRERDSRRRLERVGFRYDIATPSRRLRVEDELVFRTYTAAQLLRLVREETRFELAEIYDFGYDVDEPSGLSAETEDAILVLRKR